MFEAVLVHIICCAVKFVKFEPSVENCQSPLVWSVRVIAIPVTAPTVSTSEAAALFRNVETASPLLVVGSSRIVVKALSAVKLLPEAVKFDDPAAVNTGGSFTAFTFRVKLLVRLSTPPFAVPPLS